jgi:hypothetical protein
MVICFRTFQVRTDRSDVPLYHQWRTLVAAADTLQHMAFQAGGCKHRNRCLAPDGSQRGCRGCRKIRGQGWYGTSVRIAPSRVRLSIRRFMIAAPVTFGLGHQISQQIAN